MYLYPALSKCAAMWEQWKKFFEPYKPYFQTELLMYLGLFLVVLTMGLYLVFSV